MLSWSTVTWDVARTGGFVAYALVAMSICLGLVLSLRWRSSSWPRWATTDLHRYVTLLAIVFTAIHTLAIWLDPFMRFAPSEILVPLVSHYRAVWVAFGIVSAYLLIAIWLSERVQKRIGYAWWRRMHYLTFLIYGMATIHGIATGSDTKAGWAVFIYLGSSALVGSLLAIRLLYPGEHMKPHPRIAIGVAMVFAVVVFWTSTGPLRPGWSLAANNGNASGASGVRSAQNPSLSLPFTSSMTGQMSLPAQGGEETAVLRATLNGQVTGSLRITLQGQTDLNGNLVVDSTQLVLRTSTGIGCSGSLSDVQSGDWLGQCSDSGGNQVALEIQLSEDSSGQVTGTLNGSQA
jgi:hypothetical protein